jgi:hypothetical protein
LESHSLTSGRSTSEAKNGRLRTSEKITVKFKNSKTALFEVHVMNCFMQQLSLLPAQPTFHGGALSVRKRKTRRPISTKRALHLVLKATRPVLYGQKFYIEKEVLRLTRRFKLKCYGLAVNHDHIHLNIKVQDRRIYVAFIRSFAGLVAKKIGPELWSLLPFTRVLAWGKDFRRNLAYLKKNRGEVSGKQPYEPRKNWYERYYTPTSKPRR